jgi:nicotinamidase-related amidase
MSEHAKVLEIIQCKNRAPFGLDPLRSALLVVDVQRYFVRRTGSFGRVFEALVPGSTSGYFQRIESMVLPNVQRLLQAFRSAQRPVIFTATGCRLSEGRDLVRWLRDFDSLGTTVLGHRVWPDVHDDDYQIDESITPQPGELVMHKTSSGPLNSTGLEQILRNLDVQGLVVSGLTTDVCVTQTARELADRGFAVAIAGDACTTLSEQLHRAALEVFGLAFGRVTVTDEIAAWVGAPFGRDADRTAFTTASV